MMKPTIEQHYSRIVSQLEDVRQQYQDGVITLHEYIANIDNLGSQANFWWKKAVQQAKEVAWADLTHEQHEQYVKDALK